jgi:hypothetical protein
MVGYGVGAGVGSRVVGEGVGIVGDGVGGSLGVPPPQLQHIANAVKSLSSAVPHRVGFAS